MSVDDKRSPWPMLLALGAGLAWIVAWYWPTASQIAGIWLRSDTYAHGLAVLPVCAWLVWRKRARLAMLTPLPALWTVPAVALAGGAWLLARLVSVDGVAHFALIALLALSVPAMLGTRAGRVLLFPTLFLFFGLPAGEFMLPVLMHYTAEFTVFALRLTGVPVYQEGLFFIVPNGSWSVVEACSGLRYLAASLFVGALYAYLNYVSLKRRLLFMLVALVVPIVANWLRAYLIVLLGYLSDNRLAAGVDHLIYGWLFFGVVIVLMFWIGGFWHEEAPAQPPPAASVQALPGTPHRLYLLPVLAVVSASFPVLERVIDPPVEPFVLSLQAPPAAPGWQAVGGEPFGYLPDYSGHRGELLQTYRRDRDGEQVVLYIAYYARQREDYEMVAWHNRLLARDGGQAWLMIAGRRPAVLAAQRVLHTRLRREDGLRLSVWHWYWTNRSRITSDVLAKVYLGLDRLTGQPDDAAFVAVYAGYRDDVGGMARAHEVAEAFVQAHGDALDRLLGEVQGHE
ncbi:MAG: exosortase A [Rhodocyclaceae bacterium]